MTEKYFSTREGYVSPDGEQIKELNQKTRNRLASILSNARPYTDETGFWRDIVEKFFMEIGELPINMNPETKKMSYSWDFYKLLEKRICIDNMSLFSIFDLFEIILAELNKRAFVEDAIKNTQDELNRIFSEELVRWQMVDGKIERTLDQIEVIRKAKHILDCDEFQPAYTQFMKAWEAFNKRPDADIDGCMDNAWDALEAVAKHCAGGKVGTFGKALPLLISKGIIHDDWKHFFQKFYALSNIWVRHKENVQLTCETEDAELFLINASQMISYIITRYKKNV